MYDFSHWRSEIKASGNAPATFTRLLGRWESQTSSPDYLLYSLLPVSMRPKAMALGDTFPPNRSFNPGNFYKTTFDVEYLSTANHVIEDVDPDPFIFTEASTLDTLFRASGSTLVPPSFNPYNVCMTRYRGLAGTPGYGQDSYRPVLFTGFNLWNFARADCKQMVDAVLQGQWLMPYTPPATTRPRLPQTAGLRPESWRGVASRPVAGALRR
jgi:hypothetical protein